MDEPVEAGNETPGRANGATDRQTDGGAAVGDTGGAPESSGASVGGLRPTIDAADETERLRYERDYWRGLFEQVVEDSPDAAWVVDSTGRFAYCNDGIAALNGVDRAEIVDESVGEFLSAQGSEGMETFAQTVMREGEPRSESEPRHIPKTEGDIWVRSSGVPLRNPEGGIVAGLETASDVTGLVEQREAITQAQEQMADEVSTSAVHAEEATERVAGAISEAGELAAEQSEDMNDVSGEVASVSATVEEIAASIEEISQQSESAKRLATESTDAGERAVDRMECVAESGDDTAERTRELAEQISRIDEMVGIINEIADQTNILALNANIEAARAGEAGDGFAVVANEVKSLATQVSEESDRIEEVIEETREDAAGTVESIESVTDEIRASAEAVREVVDNQTEIVESVSGMSAGMEEIAEATDDQAGRAEEVSRMVDTAADRSRQVATAVDTAVGANEEQTELVCEIAAAIDRLESTVDRIETGGAKAEGAASR